jgi:hypothetical protein
VARRPPSPPPQDPEQVHAAALRAARRIINRREAHAPRDLRRHLPDPVDLRDVVAYATGRQRGMPDGLRAEDALDVLAIAAWLEIDAARVQLAALKMATRAMSLAELAPRLGLRTRQAVSQRIDRLTNLAHGDGSRDPVPVRAERKAERTARAAAEEARDVALAIYQGLHPKAGNGHWEQLDEERRRDMGYLSRDRTAAGAVARVRGMLEELAEVPGLTPQMRGWVAEARRRIGKPPRATARAA